MCCHLPCNWQVCDGGHGTRNSQYPASQLLGHLVTRYSITGMVSPVFWSLHFSDRSISSENLNHCQKIFHIGFNEFTNILCRRGWGWVEEAEDEKKRLRMWRRSWGWEEEAEDKKKRQRMCRRGWGWVEKAEDEKKRLRMSRRGWGWVEKAEDEKKRLRMRRKGKGCVEEEGVSRKG